MLRRPADFVSGLLALALVLAGCRDPEPVLEAELLKRFSVAEAHQGVAVDEAFFYAVDNTAIGKYNKQTGKQVSSWLAEAGQGFIHLNSCKALERQLRCAHSNSPAVPMASSIELFDKASLAPAGSHSLGFADGYLTWLDEYNGHRWGFLAHYRGRVPGRDPAWSELVRFDDQWRRSAGWLLPGSVLERLAPASASGGSWGPDGLLYVTGHDRGEIYVLALPEAGSTLRHVATIEAPIRGQAFAFDRSSGERIAYGIDRPAREVVVISLPEIPR